HHALQSEAQSAQRGCDIADRLARLHIDLSTTDQLTVLVEAGAARHRHPVAGPHGARIAEDWFPGRTAGDADDIVHQGDPPETVPRKGPADCFSEPVFRIGLSNWSSGDSLKWFSEGLFREWLLRG